MGVAVQGGLEKREGVVEEGAKALPVFFSDSWTSAGSLWLPPEVCEGGSEGGRAPKMAARRMLYPLYQYGNPQLRVFRTDYFLTLVRPGVPQPEDTVQFRIPMEMTRVELKDYLESIYNVPVATIRTRIQHGSNKQRDHKNRRIKKPDYKVAYVQLAGGRTFQFPDLFPETEETIEPGSFEDIQKKFMEDERQRQKDDPRQGGVSSWFGL